MTKNTYGQRRPAREYPRSILSGCRACLSAGKPALGTTAPTAAKAGPTRGAVSSSLRERGGDLVEVRGTGGLDEHHVAGGKVAAQPVDGRVVASQRHRPLSRTVGDRPGGLADSDHQVSPGG